jgi:Ethylene-responsive protein kinase Le-CTR1
MTCAACCKMQPHVKLLCADAAAASQFFYKEAYLDYEQLVTDGFYHVRKQFARLPMLAELEANPQLAGGQVVMVVDRSRDAPLVTLEVRPATRG